MAIQSDWFQFSKSIKTVAKTSILTGTAYSTSAELAEHVGPFKNFGKSKEQILLMRTDGSILKIKDRKKEKSTLHLNHSIIDFL